ncbi:hypothetical protein M404DRAFT_998174 [Pisolithus tinctorius Marx 270]|uniref:Uncharacterized protein n=1 Tax=Pisolithus tinctorius Marx 270 TaxID=870435 RepID=A0A0C3PHH4_PISTI|nr:hypothetical protein M404DRAFT_998174 [Pisolithus tinctorius Marx 270]
MSSFRLCNTDPSAQRVRRAHPKNASHPGQRRFCYDVTQWSIDICTDPDSLSRSPSS